MGKACGLLLAAALLASASEAGQDRPELRAKVDALRSSAQGLLKYWRVPWVTDLFEGFRLAKEERRPVFLYRITGDPLEDC